MQINFNEDELRYLILFFFLLQFLWETYLGIRQYRKTRSTTEIPAELKHTMPKHVFDKARLYTLAHLKFGFVQATFSLIMTILVLCSGILAKVWDYSNSVNPIKNEEITTSCIWLLILLTIWTVINLPMNVYHTFYLEEKFGFNKQTYGFFIWDNIKFFILTQIIMIATSSIIIVSAKSGGDYFFVWLWASLCVLSLLFFMILPSLLALFDKFTPLPEGELRTAIEALVAELNFPLKQIFIVEGSKRSSHNNAYLTGIFKEKRIVLYDTLLKKDDGIGCTNDEILAVLSHELGHWYHGHMIKNVLAIQLYIFLFTAFFAIMFKYPVLYKVVGFYRVQPVLVGFLVVYQFAMLPYRTLSSFINMYMLRRFEFQADAFAMKLGKSQPLITALVQLHKDNSILPIYDYLYSAWHHNHPTLLERIEHLRQEKHKID